ncbi:Peritrophin-1 [Apis cerana cerana]|uniref:Peritrophin-1 n=1 Tax=Apis cerana cerana TaxID=94128 RepID=A0A2A3EJC4_APICC|nr:Peritrophin-1 [Apis cerana cerana]
MKAILALALATISVTLVSATAPICPPNQGEDEVILLPNPDDCSSYYACNRGTSFLMKCNEGLEFNAELKVCDWPEKAHCHVSPRPSTEPSSTKSISLSMLFAFDGNLRDVEIIRSVTISSFLGPTKLNIAHRYASMLFFACERIRINFCRIIFFLAVLLVKDQRSDRCESISLAFAEKYFQVFILNNFLFSLQNLYRYSWQKIEYIIIYNFQVLITWLSTKIVKSLGLLKILTIKHRKIESFLTNNMKLLSKFARNGTLRNFYKPSAYLKIIETARKQSTHGGLLVGRRLKCQMFYVGRELLMALHGSCDTMMNEHAFIKTRDNERKKRKVVKNDQKSTYSQCSSSPTASSLRKAGKYKD